MFLSSIEYPFHQLTTSISSYNAFSTKALIKVTIISNPRTRDSINRFIQPINVYISSTTSQTSINIIKHHITSLDPRFIQE